jgi:hypothetical protein
MSGAGQMLMQDPVQAMLAQTSLQTTLFAANSRYYGIAVETIVLNGTVTGYIARRFVPQPSRFQVIGEHTVIQGERLDNIAAKYLGDPTLFWRLCDANNAMRPDTLTATPGRVIDITMPENVNGSPL